MQAMLSSILDEVRKNNIAQLVHISSSVVESVADDFYTNTKKDQEQMVLRSGIECPILRPTLMFGWFDRKHLGWLSRFMAKVPVFPVPDGHDQASWLRHEVAAARSARRTSS